MPAKFSLEDAKKFIVEAGATPKFEVYKGTTKKHLVQCSCGKEFEIIFMTALRKKRSSEKYILRCSECNNSNRDIEYTFEFVSELFAKFNCTPLFKKEVFESKRKELLYREFSRTFPLEYICSCGKKSESKLDFLINKYNKLGKIQCHSCGAKKGKRCQTFLVSLKEKVKNHFEQFGLTLHNLDEMENQYSKVRFTCECGNVEEITWESYKNNLAYKPRCEKCRLLSYPRGEEHASYDYTLSDEERQNSSLGRSSFFPVWSELVLKIWGFKCGIAKEGSNKLNAHHIMPWASFPSERFVLTNGIALKEEIHNEFHLKFGKHSDTTQDFYSFFQEKTGVPWNVFEKNRIEILTEPKSDLLTLKKSFFDKGINYTPIFISEAISMKNILASIVRGKLGWLTERYYAKDLEVKVVLPEIAAAFLAKNHRQGAILAKVNFGLFAGEELVSLMSFGTPRFNSNEYSWELLRFCSKLNSIVVGGAGKLFKHFLKQVDPESVVSFADLRFSSLNPEETVYSKMGFIHSHMSAPNYWYTKDLITLESRMKFQKHKLAEILPEFDPKYTELENMLKNGWFKIEDCGNHVFVWNKS